MKTSSKIKAQLRGRWKLLSGLGSFLLLGLATLLYQNCTAPIANGIKSVDALSASMPWAYDAQVDQIAYMSCSELVSGYDTSQYFMFRAGAYGSSSGISLNSAFLAKTQGGYINQRADLLDDGTANAGTKVLFAMRNVADFQSVYPSTNTAGTDWNPIFTDLGVETTSDALATAAITSTPKIKYLSTGSVPGARFEGDLEGAAGSNPMQQYRTYFNSNQILFGVNFMSASGQSFARAPADFPNTPPTTTYTANQSVYGRGLYLSFAQPTYSAGGLASTMPNYAMKSVQEYDMQGRAYIGTTSSWTCPAALQLRIVRVEDLGSPTNPPNCSIKADAQNANQAMVAIARRTLRAEDWYINTDQGCIIPKKVTGAQCYGSTAGLHVQYDETGACSAPATTGALDTSTCGYNSDGSVNTTSATCKYTTQTCVHYASICYRN